LRKVVRLLHAPRANAHRFSHAIEGQLTIGELHRDKTLVGRSNARPASGHKRLDTVRIYSQPDEAALGRAAAVLERQ
jgi:hypothetical protein